MPLNFVDRTGVIRTAHRRGDTITIQVGGQLSVSPETLRYLITMDDDAPMVPENCCTIVDTIVGKLWGPYNFTSLYFGRTGILKGRRHGSVQSQTLFNTERPIIIRPTAASDLQPDSGIYPGLIAGEVKE